jgi:hypothetical protein
MVPVDPRLIQSRATRPVRCCRFPHLPHPLVPPPVFPSWSVLVSPSASSWNATMLPASPNIRYEICLPSFLCVLAYGSHRYRYSPLLTHAYVLYSQWLRRPPLASHASYLTTLSNSAVRRHHQIYTLVRSGYLERSYVGAGNRLCDKHFPPLSNVRSRNSHAIRATRLVLFVLINSPPLLSDSREHLLS